MYVFIETTHIKPEKRDKVHTMARAFIERTRSEPGCSFAGFYQDLNDENAYVIVQKWDTKENFDQHVVQVRAGDLPGVMQEASDQPAMPELFETTGPVAIQ